MHTYLFDDTLGISDIRPIFMTVNKGKVALIELEHHGSKLLAESAFDSETTNKAAIT